MTARPVKALCARELNGRQPCLPALADGWITPQDLCAACTCRFMAALDEAHGDPLPWSAGFMARSRGPIEVSR